MPEISTPDQRIILSSTIALGLAYRSRETRITLSTLLVSPLTGGRPMAVNGSVAIPSIIKRIQKVYLFKFTISWAVNCGANSGSNSAASMAPTRYTIKVPTLPNTAALTTSPNCSIY